MKKIKIFLIDDHQLVRDGIKALLEGEKNIAIVGEAADGPEFFRKIKHQPPDIVLADISLPVMSGIDITQSLSRDYPQIKVLILSMYTHEEFVIKAIKSGAKGYLPKNTNRKELVTAIETVYQNREYFSSSISKTLIERYAQNSLHQNPEKDSENALTPRETEILKLTASGLTNAEIADRLFISKRTVESHKNHIMNKLGLKTPAELIVYAIRHHIAEIE